MVERVPQMLSRPHHVPTHAPQLSWCGVIYPSNLKNEEEAGKGGEQQLGFVQGALFPTPGLPAMNSFCH